MENADVDFPSEGGFEGKIIRDCIVFPFNGGCLHQRLFSFMLCKVFCQQKSIRMSFGVHLTSFFSHVVVYNTPSA